MDAKQKHLEMIQSVIARMDSNSFHIRGWTITLVSALFALAASGANKEYVLITYFVIPAFWALDAFYLCQERAFRGLFDSVRAKGNTEIDFSMNAKSFRVGKATWTRSSLASILIVFYCGLLLVTLIVMFVV